LTLRARIDFGDSALVQPGVVHGKDRIAGKMKQVDGGENRCGCCATRVDFETMAGKPSLSEMSVKIKPHGPNTL
jgi:hypothetical protein